MNQSSSNLTIASLSKKICICTFTTILIVILFILSPLSYMFKTSLFMKIVALIILGYTIYLSIFQTNMLKITHSISISPQLTSQLNMNIICSYIFTLFLGILLLFILRNMIFG
jgi:hypothetical protein